MWVLPGIQPVFGDSRESCIGKSEVHFILLCPHGQAGCCVKRRDSINICGRQERKIDMNRPDSSTINKSFKISLESRVVCQKRTEEATDNQKRGYNWTQSLGDVG